MSLSQNREAEFLARVTTATTHEIRNVLAIIKESAGLLEDMVRAADKGRPLEPERLMRSIDRVCAQVDRGAELMTALNRFAHGLDNEHETIDLHREAELVALMCGRMARQKGHRVEVGPGDAAVSLTANPLLVEMTLFTAVECCLQQLPGPGTVVMNTGRSGGAPCIDLVCDAGADAALPQPASAACWNRFAEALAQLDARVETENESGHFRIVFAGGSAA